MPKRRQSSRTRRTLFTPLAVELLEGRSLLAVTAQLLVDINATPTPLSGSGFIDLGGVTYFAGYEVGGGSELWRTDGTGPGTYRVKDIRPGAGSSNPTNLILLDGKLLFAANDGVNGIELWKSDGTAAGTVPVKDIRPGALGSLRDQADPQITVAGGKAFFVANDGVHGHEIWSSDGTEAGTSLVKDILSSTSYAPSISGLVNVNNMLFFSANDGTTNGLFRSDGTAAGTNLVSSGTSQALTNLNGTLLFAANGKLWRSDGTSGGTSQLSGLSGEAIAMPWFPTAGSQAFLVTFKGDQMGLWRTDGTAAGTVPLRDFIFPRNFVSVGNSVYFFEGPLGFPALYKSDGTAAGTTLVKEFGAPQDHLVPFVPLGANVNGTLFFQGADAVHGTELWKSDGTTDGTTLVKDVTPGSASSGVFGQFTSINGKLFFLTANPEGISIWQSNGTPEGTIPLEAKTATASSIPANLSAVGGAAYFSAIDTTGNRGLWKTNGSPQGTLLLRSSLALTSPVETAGATTVFAAKEAGLDDELWKSDGTPAGTVRLLDIRSGSTGSEPRQFTAVGTTVFFSANDGAAGVELWKTDGTATGTKLVKDLVPGLASSAPEALTNVAGTLFFIANKRLWKSDGSEAGTVVVKDLSSVMLGGDPVIAVAVDATFYFRPNAFELWKSDGTEAGTQRVGSFGGVGSEAVAQLINLNGKLLFSAFHSDSGFELWTIDDTFGWVTEVVNIHTEPHAGSDPGQFTVVNNTLYFLATDSLHGRELWRSDGTAAGTRIVKDLVPGPASLPLQALTAAQGRLVFTFKDRVHGTELWESDGTETGTRLLKDIAPGSDSSTPQDIQTLTSGLVFTAEDYLHGREVWSLSDKNVAPTFIKGPDQSVTYKSGPRSVAWASGLSAGGTEEQHQLLSFVLTNDNTGLFSVQPTINQAGILSFSPAANAVGTANLSVKLQDSGGTANGGVDTSAVYNFTITIRAPGPRHNLAKPRDVSGDGKILAGDALDVINYLNAFGGGSAPLAGPSVQPFYDVSGDDFILPGDALDVINFLNAFGPEGEGTDFTLGAHSGLAASCEGDWISLLALDQAGGLFAPRRRLA